MYFSVATFYHRGSHPPKKSSIRAYTRYFNKDWDGCEMFKVWAENGTQAKRRAIQMRLNKEKLKHREGES